MFDWLECERNRKYHPIASLFPLMEGPEFDALKEDIATHGLLEPIWIDAQGLILDGRNRHRACIETQTEPQFRTWDNDGSLVSFVVSMNLKRRHLNSSQRAVVALDILPMLEEERRHGGDRRSQTFQDGNSSILNGTARKHVATLADTNPHYVQDAKRIQKEAPDLLEQIRSGDKTIPKAKRELTRRQKQESPPLPDDKYRVWYADPPWQYSNNGIIGETDHYGHVERHYPSMSIADLCTLGPDIQSRSSSDAVLFLWVTSPLLEECFEVIRAWGFRYKTSFVWDKIRHNFGHYNSVRHEFLLICTRGSCTPDIPELFDSVQSIERTQTHSEKPEEFRQIIDTLYPHGKRIELFARTHIDGWECWGNEG